MTGTKVKHTDKNTKSGYHGKQPEVVSPITEPAPEDVPEPPAVLEPPKEVAPTDIELLQREIESIQIARPKRVRSKELVSLLPYYKPKPRAPLLVVWTDLNYTTVLRLSEAKNADETRRILAEHMALSESISNTKDQITLDLYCQAIHHATKMKFNFEQTSAMFSIVKNVHEKGIETPVDNTKECLEYMDAMICRHVVKRPPWSAHIFDAHQAEQLRDYIIRSYFRHFEMYKYVFTPTVCMDLKVDYQQSAVAESHPAAPDPVVHNPVTNSPVCLEDVLTEIDLEEQAEQTGAEVLTLPIHHLPTVSKVQVEQAKSTKIPHVQVSQVPIDPRLVELEQLVSKQMDTQLAVLREKITDKLRLVDNALRNATGLQGPIDSFSLQPEAPTDVSHKSGKSSPHRLPPTALVPEPKKKPKK